ncbi:hypothetical protein RIF29_00404 [Crotalaria pallida]|uniref:CCHC-type domain-containing protein n=1 Tax=Crotalaria pallida TaxID=3830 RepID=A0AAN9IVU0_CROPI
MGQSEYSSTIPVELVDGSGSNSKSSPFSMCKDDSKSYVAPTLSSSISSIAFGNMLHSLSVFEGGGARFKSMSIEGGGISVNMTDVLEDSIMVNHEPSPLEPYEGMEFKSIEDAKNYYLSVMVQSLDVSERASRSEKHHDVAVEGLQKLIEELDRLEVEESNEEYVNSTNQVIPEVSNNVITLRDPPIVATKGCPRTLRMKGSLELHNKGSSTCSNCKQKGHKKPKCPSFKKTKV